MKALRGSPEADGKPTLVLANTIKGKGVSFAENKPEWHHHVPSDDQLKQAHEELDAALAALEGEEERSGTHA